MHCVGVVLKFFITVLKMKIDNLKAVLRQSTSNKINLTFDTAQPRVNTPRTYLSKGLI